MQIQSIKKSERNYNLVRKKRTKQKNKSVGPFGSKDHNKRKKRTSTKDYGSESFILSGSEIKAQSIYCLQNLSEFKSSIDGLTIEPIQIDGLNYDFDFNFYDAYDLSKPVITHDFDGWISFLESGDHYMYSDETRTCQARYFYVFKKLRPTFYNEVLLPYLKVLHNSIGFFAIHDHDYYYDEIEAEPDVYTKELIGKARLIKEMLDNSEFFCNDYNPFDDFERIIHKKIQYVIQNRISLKAFEYSLDAEGYWSELDFISITWEEHDHLYDLIFDNINMSCTSGEQIGIVGVMSDPQNIENFEKRIKELYQIGPMLKRIKEIEKNLIQFYETIKR